MSTTYNALADAIVQIENSQWPNNPGALKDLHGNKIEYPSFQEGYDALLTKLAYDASGASSIYSPEMTLKDFETLYTGGDTNAANTLAAKLGVPSDTLFKNLSDQNLEQPSQTDTSSVTQNEPTTIQKIFAETLGKLFPLPGNTNPDGTKNADMPNSIFANVTAVLIGLVLIAGAVFSFSQVKETVINTAKTAAKFAA